jgi:hypothetical protein
MRIDLHQYDELLGLPPPVEVPSSLAAAWRLAGIAWEQPAAHDALVGLAVKHGQLGWLASRYRERQSDPIAARELERVRRAATVVMLTAQRHAQPEPDAFRRVWWSLALCALITIGALAGARVAVNHATGHAGAPALVAP